MKRLSLGKQQWKEIVSQWEKSGESMSAYSKTKGISKSSLGYWVGKFRKENKGVSSGFLKLPAVKEYSTDKKNCEILFPNGTKLMFYEKPDYRILKQLFS
jgi:hypothetical protein